MKPRQISFAVSAVTPQATGAVVAGRCCQEEIRIGDVFDLTYRIDVKLNSKGDASGTQRDPREILVCVAAIRSYGKQWDKLDPGMTGELVLQGVDATTLQSEEILAKTSNRPR